MCVCECVCVCVNINNIKNKEVTVVEGDPKAPFSIATSPRCTGERYFFPWIVQLDP